MLLNDGSSKTLMVDERQNVREVLYNLFEKTHCDCNVDWSLCETNPDLQLGELLQYSTVHHQHSYGKRCSALNVYRFRSV